MVLIAHPTAKRPRSSLGIGVAALFVAFPAIFFYAFLFRTALDLPFYDDYDATLDFMNQLTQLNGFAAKASFLLATQHNEYKLFFEQALIWLQFSLYGRVDFKVLSAAGNAFVLLLALLLWKIFLPACKDNGLRLALFVPVSWLLFQFEYYEVLNWGSASLMHITVLVFAFTAIYLLFQTARRAFYGALACYVLAVASSGNGFLILPIGLLILGIGRHYARAAGWLIVSAGCVAVYSYHYNVMSSQTQTHRSVFAALLRMRPAYVISFMGSAGGVPFMAGSFVLGSALCLFFAWMAYRGYIRRNPIVSCCVLFLLLSALGVAGIRSDLGLAQSLSSRYTIYSALLLIFAWYAIVEEFLQHRRVSPLNNGAYLSAVIVAMLFSLFMDAVGCLLIERQDRLLLQGMTSFEHPATPESTEGPDIPLPDEPAWRASFKPHARAVLIKSIRLGVYRPPTL
jgi:hypothetical protein